MKGKKIVGWFLCILALVGTVFLPFVNVFAAPKVGESSISELADLYNYIQAANTCKNDVATDYYILGNKDNINGNHDRVKNLLNMNISAISSKAFYSESLEVGATGKYGNGKVTCEELGDVPFKKMIDVYSEYSGKVGQEAVTDIMCGVNGKAGLYRISFSGTAAKDWENLSCSKQVDDFLSYLSSSDKEVNYAGEDVRITININDEFEFEDFLADGIGDIEQIKNDIVAHNTFQNFRSVCGGRFIDAEEYYGALSEAADTTGGGDSSAYHKIYYDGEIYYYYRSADEPQTKIHVGSVTENETKTCLAVLDELEDKAEGAAENNTKNNINNCINKAIETKKTMEEVANGVNAIYSYGTNFAKALRDKGFEYGNVYVSNIGSRINTLKSQLSSMSSSGSVELSALESFASATRDLASQMASLSNKTDLTDDEINKRIDEYVVKLGKFKSGVVDEVDSAAKGTAENIEKANQQKRVREAVEGLPMSPGSKVEGFYEIDGSGNFTCTVDKNIGDSFGDMGKALGANISYDSYDGKKVDSGGSSGGSNSKDEKLCANQGGVKSLGWIVCPILEWLADTSKDVYDDYVEPGLQIEPELFGGGNGDILEGWRTFQGFANTLFIILFLVVIFSQLTGYGIDNYGIKKILPKLIVTAILINLSFIICQIAVDLSNILGNSLQTLFDNLGQKGTISFVINDAKLGSSNSISVDLSGKLASVLALSGIVTGLAALWANPAIIISLLVSALSVFVSIFFLFIILAARKAAIAVLMVISPLAFACLVLPNTKKLFDKWLKAGQALLLVYPICGLLVGGGNYVSRLLLSSETTQESFFLSFTAMIVGIVPIFFIPSVLKGSFGAMGNLGAKISGIGSKVKGGADKAIRGSDRYKNAQQRGLNRRNERSLRRRSGGRIGRDGKFSETNILGRRTLRSRFAGSRLGRLMGSDVAMGEAREQFVQSRIGRDKKAANLNISFANAALQDAETELKDQRMKAEVKVELGPKPELDRNNFRTRLQNEINEAHADNKVSVLPIEYSLALRRRQSAVEAQELKAFQDQFAGMSQAQLRNEANNAQNWLSTAGGQQRMSALLQTMESNGMESEMTNILKNNNMSAMDNVMKTLANSKNAVFSAYGKRANDGNGNLVDFGQFMTGTNKQSMQGYMSEKGNDVISRLDDKSLATIRYYQDKNPNVKIMSTNQLIEAASKINSEDSMLEINEMLKKRNDISMSGEQLATLNLSTVQAILDPNNVSNASARQAILTASDDIANNPQMINKLSSQVRQEVNKVRTGGSILNPNGGNGRQPI